MMRNQRVYSSLIAATCVLVGALCSLADSLPLALPAVAQEVKLQSRRSGHYVQVSENGDVEATSAKNSATVFIKYLTNSAVQFEVKNKPGMFLILRRVNESSDTDANDTSPMPIFNTSTAEGRDSNTYALVVDYAVETSLTRWGNGGVVDTLRSLDGDASCYIAFDTYGKVAGPCNLVASDMACAVRIVG